MVPMYCSNSAYSEPPSLLGLFCYYCYVGLFSTRKSRTIFKSSSMHFCHNRCAESCLELLLKIVLDVRIEKSQDFLIALRKEPRLLLGGNYSY